MTLSMIAVADTSAGVAQTLMSLMPVFIIPVIWILYGEKTNVRGILGAIVAVIGVAVLFIA
jgi:drug/metabolite transporter (DMT)-like permease